MVGPITFDTSNQTYPDSGADFLIYGATYFSPNWYPDTFRVTKQRNLDRSDNFCKGQDITDNGSKNRDIHIQGWMLGNERVLFDELVETDEPVEVSAATWSGEVRVKEGEFEGPFGEYPPSGQMTYKYTLDLVATGVDEGEGANGIISRGAGVDHSGGGDDAFSNP